MPIETAAAEFMPESVKKTNIRIGVNIRRPGLQVFAKKTFSCKKTAFSSV